MEKQEEGKRASGEKPKRKNEAERIIESRKYLRPEAKHPEDSGQHRRDM